MRIVRLLQIPQLVDDLFGGQLSRTSVHGTEKSVTRVCSDIVANNVTDLAIPYLKELLVAAVEKRHRLDGRQVRVRLDSDHTLDHDIGRPQLETLEHLVSGAQSR